jgi:predicted GNAT superfamily acetyltransferase
VPSSDQNLSISVVDTLRENDVALGVCRKVWGATAAQDHELYWVIATHGGYLSVARLDGEPVGVSLGILAHRGADLVSHFTGVIPGFAGAGVGFALKQHQRAWAQTHGIETITWTFDPLDDVLVEVPADIEAMRVAHLALATQWRRDLRAIVHEPLRNGWHLAGMTADYRYVLRPPKKESS